jgi:hypothetical protein
MTRCYPDAVNAGTCYTMREEQPHQNICLFIYLFIYAVYTVLPDLYNIQNAGKVK